MNWTQPARLPLAPRPKKRPQQQRSARSFAAIRDAALLILEREGVAALTTNRVAELAGVGIASVYQYFPNKEAILTAVYDHLLELERAELDRVNAAITGRAGAEAVAYLIDRGIALRRRFVTMAPDFYRQYHREFQLAARYRADDPDDGIRNSMAAAGLMFEQFGPDLRVANNRVIQFLFTRGVGAMIDRAAEEQPALLDEPEFRAALVDMVTGFLLRSRAAGTGRGQEKTPRGP